MRPHKEPLVYEGTRGVLPHVTHTRLGDQWDVGEEMVVLFKDHIVTCEVTDVEPVDWEDVDDEV